jgi:hypothetical protein
MSAPTAAELRARRYGERPRTRRPFVVVVIVAAVLATAVVVWIAVGLVRPQASGDAPAYTVRGVDEIDVRLEVTRPPGTTATCTVEALGNGFGQVGLLDVTVPPGTNRVAQVRVSLATSERAHAVVVRDCWIEG